MSLIITCTNDNADKLTEIKVSGVTVKSFGYDGAGRTTSVVTGAGTTTVAYDYEGRISQITYPSTATNTFAYNGLDTRVSKVDSAGTATYKRDGAHVTAPVISDGSATYTPSISERRSSTTKYYGSDRLGTNALETNSSQTVTATKTYDAFGMPVASTGSSASPFGFAGQHGYQEDADSGLKLLGHRYYDASTGRFLTRDRAKDGRNWYGYCENNPLKYVDPDGFKLNLVGGTKEERAEFWLALFWIWTTKEGRPLVEELLNGDKVYTIIIDPGSKTGRPNWNNNTTILFINPKDGGVEYLGTDGKYHNFSWIGLLSHELGHLVGGLGSDKEQETVDGFENKIGGQFGIPGRGKYDDTKFGKPKPLLKPPRLRFPR